MITERKKSIQVNDPWYTVNGQKDKFSPRNAIELGHLVPRDKQTAITRLKTGVLKSLKYKNKIKTFEQCTVHLVTADPEHILECLEIQRQDLYDNPLMVAEKMGTAKHRHIMELV